MKKLILGLAVAAGSLVFAQEKTVKPHITYGVKAGLNVSSLTKTNELNNFRPKAGFYGGGFINIPLSNQFSLQPEILFSQSGGKYDKTFGNKKYSFTRNVNNIAIPVMFQYKALPNFYLEAGPEFDIALRGSIKAESGASDLIEQEEANHSSLSRLNLGIGIGAGYYFTSNFGVTARYTAGLTETRGLSLIDDKSMRNNVFQVGLTYRFK